MKTYVNRGIQAAAGKKVIIVLFLFLLLISMTKAQDSLQEGIGRIKITLIDRTSLKPLPFANVQISENGRQVNIRSANKHGEIEFTDLVAGTYSIKGFDQGYKDAELSGLIMEEGDELIITLKMQNLHVTPQDISKNMMLQQAEVQSRKRGHAFLQITANVLTIICYVIGNR